VSKKYTHVGNRGHSGFDFHRFLIELFWHGNRIESRQRIQYRFARLTKDQRELLEMVLLEEMDVQRWFSVAWIVTMGEEFILPLN
jgi:hypothetical protein